MKNTKTSFNYIVILLMLLISILLNSIFFKNISIISIISTFSVLLITLLLVISNNIIKKIIGIFLLFFVNIEIIYSIVVNSRVTIAVLNSIIESDLSQFMLVTRTFILNLILPSLILMIIISYYSNKFKKYFKSNFSFSNVALCSVFLTILLIAFKVKNEYKLIPNIKENKKELGVFLHKKIPLILGDASYLFISMFRNTKYKNTNEIQKFNNAILLKHVNLNNNIILIMGESSLFSHYSAYGYQLNTSPNMARIFSAKNACIINNVHSSASITRDSLSMTLSFLIPGDETNLFQNKSIIEMAKHNGYKTYWIGSQEITSTHGSKYGFIAQKSDFIKLTNHNDDKLSKYLRYALSDKAEKKLIVIHLWGNHIPYHNYDKKDKIALPTANEYDLTIHHTDRIVNNLIHIIKEKNNNYNILYTSDHGEIINSGHGLEKGREQYLIPLMYMHHKNSKYNCQFIESFRNTNGYISGLMNKYILSILLGYKIDENILAKEREYDRVLTANENVLLFSAIE